MFYESLLSLENDDHVCVFFFFFFSAFMGTNTELRFQGAVTMKALLTTGSPDFVAGCLVGCCLLVNACLSLEISRSGLWGQKRQKEAVRGVTAISK